jgi:hypothetical protein
MSLPVSSGRRQGACRAVAVALLSAFLVTGCVKHLPPAPTPEPRQPAIALSVPPAEGRGRLVIDVVEGPSLVHRVRMEPRQIDDEQGGTRLWIVELPEPLCTVNQCVVEPPLGNLVLGFPVAGNPGALDLELVHVGTEPSVYRRTLSRYEDKNQGATTVLGIIGASLGAASAITGIALLPIGLSDGNDDLTIAGGITLGAGAAALALGILAIRADADTYRPGAANHFSLSSSTVAGAAEVHVQVPRALGPCEEDAAAVQACLQQGPTFVYAREPYVYCSGDAAPAEQLEAIRAAAAAARCACYSRAELTARRVRCGYGTLMTPE